MSFLYRRGDGFNRRVMHCAAYNRMGSMTGRSLCGRTGFDTSINIPLGRPICKECKAKAAEEAQ